MSSLMNMQVRRLKYALAAAAVAAIGFAASSASAADCVNGYRTLESGLVITCSDSAAGAAAVAPVSPAEPRFTGSIQPRDPSFGEAPAATSRSLMVDSPEKCFPGAYRTIQHDSSVTPVPCR